MNIYDVHLLAQHYCVRPSEILVWPHAMALARLRMIKEARRDST